ncbi:MAG: MBL fold metallo-hydrolase [Gammaproteobacteria bacterium]|nr:MBL fold metallo-hydrolase [Gammaproteobacteria bacterium]
MFELKTLRDPATATLHGKHNHQPYQKLKVVITKILAAFVIGFYFIGAQADEDYVSGINTTKNRESLVTKLKNKLYPEDIPLSAQGPAIPAKGYFVEEIKDGVYWITEGGYQMMFLTTGQGVIVVDAPPTIGSNIFAAIAEVTNEPITHLIYSHSHRDHIGSARLFPSTVQIIAHEDTYAQVKRAAIESLPLPTITFSDRYILSVGNKVVELAYYGPHHELGNIYIYVPRQKVLMLVDVIMPGWVPFKNLDWAQEVTGFLQAHDRVLSYDFDTFIGGHVGRLGTRKEIETARDYISDVLANSAKAFKAIGLSVSDLYVVAREVGTKNVWRVFDAYLDVVAQDCTERTLRQWRYRLAGADVFTEDHCWVVGQYLRLD